MDIRWDASQASAMRFAGQAVACYSWECLSAHSRRGSGPCLFQVPKFQRFRGIGIETATFGNLYLNNVIGFSVHIWGSHAKVSPCISVWRRASRC